jgi:amidase
LDYPGLAVPTPIRAGSRDDYPNARYEDVEPLGAADQETKMLWTEHDYRGAPIGLNIVAKRHMENELLAAVGMIQQALGLP